MSGQVFVGDRGVFLPKQVSLDEKLFFREQSARRSRASPPDPYQGEEKQRRFALPPSPRLWRTAMGKFCGYQLQHLQRRDSPQHDGDSPSVT